MKMNFVLFTIIILFTINNSLAATNINNNSKPLKDGKSLNVASNEIFTCMIPFKIAEKRGLYKKYGVNVNNVPFNHKNMIPPLIHGSIDVSPVFIGADLFNAYTNGFKFKIVADCFRNEGYVLVRRELWDIGDVKRIEDLKRRKIRASGEGKGTYFALANLLKSAGLSIKTDVELITGLPPHATLSAFQNSSIDAGTMSEPFLTISLKQNICYKMPQTSDEYQMIVLVASEKALKTKREALSNFLLAYVEALNFYFDAVNGVETNKEQVSNLFMEITQKPKEFVSDMTWHTVGFNGKVDKDSIEEMMHFFIENEMLIQKVNIDEIIDYSFLPKK